MRQATKENRPARGTWPTLTERKLNSLKPAPKGEHYYWWDGSFSGFGVRVSDAGRKTFVLNARFGSGAAVARALGQYHPDAFTLADARKKARDWRDLIERGKDPKEEIEREKQEAERQRENERQAEARKQAHNFAAVAIAFGKYVHRIKLRTADELARMIWKDIRKPIEQRELRDEFKDWAAKPLAEIPPSDVRAVLEDSVEREAPYTAFKQFALIRRMFNWAIGTDKYGVEKNPCDKLDTGAIIGKRKKRDRVLTDEEIRALWRASEKADYVTRAVYRLLLLNGLRLGEVSEASWPEFERAKTGWTIPKERMKATRGEPKPHYVPLAAASIAELERLPRFADGDFLFGQGGMRGIPSAHFSDRKRRIDELMLAELKQMAVERGDDPKKVALKPWVNHDLRRTVRSNLSALKVDEEVREAVVAHVRPGIKETYDLYEYREEKREALSAWARRIALIADEPAYRAVDMYLVGGADIDDGEKNRRRREYLDAIMIGGERWTAWLRSISNPRSKVVKLHQART